MNQTKRFGDPSMDVYLCDGPRVHRVARGPYAEDGGGVAEHWRLDGDAAVFQRRHALESVVPPRELVFYTSCEACPPVLVRCDRLHAWGDLVDGRPLWVEFRATFGDRRRIERTSGTRDDLAAELRGEGLRVLRDDEPLAIAHAEVRAARERPPRRGRH
ncbi:MAG: hypothetical protein WD227_02185 [Vicinamibacterales bacterium]